MQIVGLLAVLQRAFGQHWVLRVLPTGFSIVRARGPYLSPRESIGECDGHGGHTDATTGQWQCGGGGTHCFAEISGWFCLEVEGEFFVCVALFIDLLTDQVQPLSRRTMKA